MFQVALLQQFTQSHVGNLYEVLIALQQTRIVAQYREDLELLSAPLKDVDDEVLMGIFINGLREEIKAKLRLSKLGTLTQIMDQSQRIEEKNWAHLPKHMHMTLSRGSMPFSVTENSRTRSVTNPYVRGAAIPFHSARTTVATVPRRVQEQKRGENVQPGHENSAKCGGAYKRPSDA